MEGAGTFEFSISTHFDAAHRLLDELYGSGTRLHGHTYSVTVRLRASSLLDQGMVVDHYTARDLVHEIVGRLHDTYLNDHPELRDLNTTPEVIARFIWNELHVGLTDPRVESMSVEIGESPTQSVSYEAPPFRRD